MTKGANEPWESTTKRRWVWGVQRPCGKVDHEIIQHGNKTLQVSMALPDDNQGLWQEKEYD